MARRRHHHDRGDEVRRGGRGLHQPQRHPDELLRRAACRGAAGSPARRRSTGPTSAPTSPASPNIPLTQRHGFIFEVPAGGQSNREPITSGRTLRPRGGGLRPARGHPVPHRGQLRLPVRLLPVHPRAQPDAHRSPRQRRPAADAGRARASPTPTWRRSQPRGATYRVEWVDIDDPDPTFPYTPGRDRADHQQRRHQLRRRTRAGRKGAARFSRLEGAACATGVVYFTSTQGGGPAEATDGPVADGWGNGSGQVWAYSHPRRRCSSSSTSRPGPTPSTCPTTSPCSKRGTRGALRGQHQRQLRPRPHLGRPAVRHRARTGS